MNTLDQRGLPSNPDAERMILGSLLVGAGRIKEIAAVLDPSDFCLEPHRRIFAAMRALDHVGRGVDRVTVAEQLRTSGHLEAIGGLTYLYTLDEGMPVLPCLDAYVSIVRDKAILRRLIVAAQGMIDRCLTAGDNLGEIIASAEHTIAQLGATNTPHGDWLQPGQIIKHHPGGLQQLISPVAGGVGIPTGWRSLDARLCGLHAGDLFILAGRPGMGKSVAAMQMAYRAAKSGYPAAFISLEMSKASLIQRTISAVGNIDSQRMRAGTLGEDERKRANYAANFISDLPLFIDDTRARTSPAVTSALRKLRARAEVKLLVVDHLQLMRSTSRQDKRNYELAEIIGDLKHLAMDEKICVMVLSQLNRECEIENRVPQLSDLRDCGDIEQDADVVMFVHRPERYQKNRDRADLRGAAEFIVGKQRNGPIGSVRMVFLGANQKFEEAAIERENHEHQPGELQAGSMDPF